MFFFGIERGGGFSEDGRRGGAHLRWEGVAGRGGGGLNFFFGCRNIHQVLILKSPSCRRPSIE